MRHAITTILVISLIASLFAVVKCARYVPAYQSVISVGLREASLQQLEELAQHEPTTKLELRGIVEILAERTRNEDEQIATRAALALVRILDSRFDSESELVFQSLLNTEQRKNVLAALLMRGMRLRVWSGDVPWGDWGNTSSSFKR